MVEGGRGGRRNGEGGGVKGVRARPCYVRWARFEGVFLGNLRARSALVCGIFFSSSCNDVTQSGTAPQSERTVQRGLE